RFNQLTVFDARLPHGVAAVHGTRDPLRSRVVIQGWFKRPRLIVSSTSPTLRAAVEALASRLQAIAEVFTSLAGTLTMRLNWDTQGKITAVATLTDTLVVVGREAPTSRPNILGALTTDALA